MTDIENPHGITAAERDKAAAVAKVRPTKFARAMGYYPVTVGGYDVGRVVRHEVEPGSKVCYWTAKDHTGKPLYVPAATIGTTGVFSTRGRAAKALGRTDEAVMCYRTAALEGAFGWAEQSAAIASLDAEIGNLPYELEQS